jgi:hypothetical protein
LTHDGTGVATPGDRGGLARFALFVECFWKPCPGCGLCLPAWDFAQRLDHPSIKMILSDVCRSCREGRDADVAQAS